MRLNVWSRLLIVLIIGWLVAATLIAWSLHPVITELGFAISRSPNPLWHLSSVAPFIITPNVPGLLSLYCTPIIAFLLLYAAAMWVVRGARDRNA